MSDATERADVQKIREAAEFVGGEGYAAVASALHESADSLADALRETEEALAVIAHARCSNLAPDEPDTEACGVCDPCLARAALRSAASTGRDGAT